MKHYFFRKYYKFVLNDGYSFALIDSYSDEGKMNRLIKENVSVPMSFVFKKKNEVILERKDNHSSMEYVY